MLSYTSEKEFESKDFNADKVKLYESMRQKFEKIYAHEFLHYGPPNLERYSLIEKDVNSLDETELKEKNWVRDKKIHQDLQSYVFKKGIQSYVFKKESKKSAKIILRQYQWKT